MKIYLFCYPYHNIIIRIRNLFEFILNLCKHCKPDLRLVGPYRVVEVFDMSSTISNQGSKKRNDNSGSRSRHQKHDSEERHG